MTSIIIFNKPYQVLSQFTDTNDRAHLGHFIEQAGYYAAGRLDYDSEGLMLLTDHGPTQHLITSKALEKTYLVQVDGRAMSSQLQQLRQGIAVKDYVAQALDVKLVGSKPFWVWKRNPPIRVRKSIPTSWVSVTINQGKNRQVRRMFAAVGLPVLRLIRTQVGTTKLADLAPGSWQFIQFK